MNTLRSSFQYPAKPSTVTVMSSEKEAFDKIVEAMQAGGPAARYIPNNKVFDSGWPEDTTSRVVYDSASELSVYEQRYLIADKVGRYLLYDLGVYVCAPESEDAEGQSAGE